MNRARVMDAVSPYVELFGVESMGPGRPEMGSKAFSVLPVHDLPPLDLVGSKENAIRIRKAAAGRALTAMKAIFAAEYKKIYRKEMLFLALKQAQEDGRTVSPEVARRLGVTIPARVRRVTDDLVEKESA